MNRALLQSLFEPRSRLAKAAVLVWLGLLLVVSVRVMVSPHTKTVYPIFSAAGRFWWDGLDLSDTSHHPEVQGGYRYGPTIAVLVTPFAMLPDGLGGVAWRWCNALALLGSLGWLARSTLPTRPTVNQYAWLLLLTVPLCLQSVSNGQANLFVAACMLGTIAAVCEERWNIASALMALAFVIKLYPLALGLVLVVLYPRPLSWRLPIALVVSLLAPFLTQAPSYVVEQYTNWITNLRAEDRSGIQVEHMYRDVWLLIHLYGLPISRTVYQALQVGAGLGIAVLCWRRQLAGWPTRVLLMSTLALVSTWMMLLGPATESSSFVLLAPSLAWSVIEAMQLRVGIGRGILLWTSCALFTCAVVAGAVGATVVLHHRGIHVWASLCYAGYILAWQPPLASATHEPTVGHRLAA